MVSEGTTCGEDGHRRFRGNVADGDDARGRPTAARFNRNPRAETGDAPRGDCNTTKGLAARGGGGARVRASTRRRVCVVRSAAWRAPLGGMEFRRSAGWTDHDVSRRARRWWLRRLSWC